MEDQELVIETPERIDLTLEYAGVGSRFVAQIIDELYKWLIISAMGLVTLVVYLLIGPAKSLSPFVTYLLIGLGVILFFIIYFGYDIYFEARNNGQTPGKKKTEIRVIKDGGYPLDLNSVVIRNLVGIVDMLPIYYLLGFIVIMLNKKQQRLGDMAAGTLVIRERFKKMPTDPFAAKKNSDLQEHLYSFPPMNLAKLSAQDVFIIKNYFQRYDQIEEQARNKLAVELANQYIKKMAIENPPFNDAAAVKFLEELYLAHQDFAKHL